MRVNHTDLIQTGLAGTATVSDAKQSARTFGAALAETAAKAEKAPKHQAAPKHEAAPKGETTQKVEGHDYVEVMSGPRNGMFINKSGNERDGQAFVRKRGADYDLHIYGEGRHREIVKVPHGKAAKQSEETTPVEGRPYTEITSGPRNGMYVNTTSNERSGEAFVLVKRADRDLHIYGSGKDRRVIVSWHKDRDEDAKKPGAATETKPVTQAETGGVSGPTTA
jgi:hypothetical protein